MIPFATFADLQAYKYIASSVKNNDSWSQFLSEAQLLDVKSWLGDPLFSELEDEITALSVSVMNQALLDGGKYTYLNRTYRFQGLRAAIIYYAFARFTNRTAFNYTAAGIVIKDSDLSTPITDKQMQRLETEARLTADAIKCEVINYLNRNYTLFPLWRSSGFCGCRSGCGDSRPFQVVGD